MKKKGKKQGLVTLGTLGTIGRTKETITIRVPCSCCGENERCYKCDGTGIEEKRVHKSQVYLYQPGGVRYQGLAAPIKPTGFARDSRGGIYGIRENGRFSSAPDHDATSDSAFSDEV